MDTTDKARGPEPTLSLGGCNLTPTPPPIKTNWSDQQPME